MKDSMTIFNIFNVKYLSDKMIILAVRILLVIIIYLNIPSLILAQTIISAPNGGSWKADSTWIGNKIPTALDTVIISDNTIVTLDTTGSCADITINGIIVWVNKMILNVHGNFNGSDTLAMTKGSNVDAYLNLYGDFNFNGMIDQDLTLCVTFSGNADQTIKSQGSNSWYKITALKDSGTIFFTITPDVSYTYFTSGSINYNGGDQKILVGPYPNDLTISGTGIKTLTNAVTVYGNLNINSGTTLADGGFTLTANGNISNSGIHSGVGKISMCGSTISGCGSFQNLEINNVSGVSLNGNLRILDTLSLINGNLNTGINTLTLSPAGKLLGEQVGRYVIGNLTTTRSVNTDSSDFGGIGVALNAGVDNLGDVTVTRVSGTSGIITIGSNSSIARNWTITPGSQPVSGRTLTFYWLGDDENGVDPTSVIVYRNDSGTWSPVGSAQNATTLSPPMYAASVITDKFSQWTIGGSASPLPVELSSFNASVANNVVNLKWTTATEVMNYGFDVERSTGNNIWQNIGFVKGSGNSNSPKNYSFSDNSISSGKYSYRLKQIDNNGAYKYSKEIEITLNKPLTFQLHQNYPNPFNPSTTIKYDVPVSDKLTIKVYNFIGQEIATLFDGARETGSYEVKFDGRNLASGIYFISLKSSSFSKNIKMVLMK